MKIKVCGMREPGNITALGSLHPDYMGLIFYDASALLGPRAFDGVRWAARLSDGVVAPNEVLGRWTAAEGVAPQAATVELLAAECLLEAGSLEVVRKRESPGQPAHDSRLHASVVRLVAFARDVLGS